MARASTNGVTDISSSTRFNGSSRSSQRAIRSSIWVGRGRQLDQGLAHHVVEPAIIKGDAIFADYGLVILAVLFPGHAAHLKHVDEVGVEEHLDGKVHGDEVEVFKAHAVEEDLRRQHLLAAHVDGVLGKIKRIAQGDVAGGQLDLRGKCFFGARREHHGAMAADAQLQVAEEAGVVVEETNVRRARRMDVAGDIGSAEGFAVDEGEVVNLPRLHRGKGKTRLQVGRRDLNQPLVGKCEIRTHQQ